MWTQSAADITDLVKGLSDATISQLLDRLHEKGVITEEEREQIENKKDRADKARELIDRICNTGHDAASALTTALNEVDSFLFRNLNLRQKQEKMLSSGDCLNMKWLF
uniref:CARD domain-containing protein n=1 Tax=Stegastes partitus TaxID=144197 RepID=A0A3B4Z056_9TELE